MRHWRPVTLDKPMFTLGQTLPLTGNFTLLKYIEALSPADLERTLGFEPGRLGPGFCIAMLAPGQALVPADFELKASTRWSAGVIGAGSAAGGRQIETLLGQRGQDAQALKAKVCAFITAQRGNTPAKVLPQLRHAPGMRYPDAEALAPSIRSGVPQFDLKVPRLFRVLRVSVQGAAG